MTAQVECHSGYEYAERPQAFQWEGQRLEISEITAEWRTPLSHCFRVCASDGRCFELSYQEIEDEWMVKIL